MTIEFLLLYTIVSNMNEKNEQFAAVWFVWFSYILLLMFINYKFAFSVYELDHITTNTVCSAKQPQCKYTWDEWRKETAMHSVLQKTFHIIMWVWKCFGFLRSWLLWTLFRWRIQFNFAVILMRPPIPLMCFGIAIYCIWMEFHSRLKRLRWSNNQLGYQSKFFSEINYINSC